MSEARQTARALAEQAIAAGEPTAWFERLYSGAADAGSISWADLEPNPNLLEWLEQRKIRGTGRRALVVGCGLGDDAEELARRGFEVVAFDIAPSAIAWAERRFPASPVRYVVSDALAPAADWRGAFDFVLESYTLQVLPAGLRAALGREVAGTIAPGGELLVIARGREPGEPEGEMPWRLTLQELRELFGNRLRELDAEDYLDREQPPVRRLRVSFGRPH